MDRTPAKTRADHCHWTPCIEFNDVFIAFGVDQGLALSLTQFGDFIDGVLKEMAFMATIAPE